MYYARTGSKVEQKYLRIYRISVFFGMCLHSMEIQLDPEPEGRRTLIYSLEYCFLFDYLCSESVLQTPRFHFVLAFLCTDSQIYFCYCVFVSSHFYKKSMCVSTCICLHFIL